MFLQLYFVTKETEVTDFRFNIEDSTNRSRVCLLLSKPETSDGKQHDKPIKNKLHCVVSGVNKSKKYNGFYYLLLYRVRCGQCVMK